MLFWKKIKIVFLILPLLMPLLSARHRSPKIGLSIYGSLNLFLESGSKSDYEIGVNEFPITASHTSYGFGTDLHINPRNRFSWGVTLQYFLDGDSTILDPVDDDRADVQSHGFLSGFISFSYHVVSQPSLSLSLDGGAGGYYLLENQGADYTTRKGYVLEIEPADKESGFAAFAGVSLDIWISSSLSILLQSRYHYLAAHAGQGAVLFQVGITLVF
jgi:hypothetical protein